ncbi:MAG: hypothetical protein Q7V88_15050 [Actinomycetota bacterium]|nr:hypothetical protein [Actinomycetota bacterium]
MPRQPLLAPLFVVALVGCSASPQQSATTETVAPTTTGWQSAAFDGYIDEYLDPSWTSEPVASMYGAGDMFANQPCVRADDTQLEGYVTGEVVVVSADRRQLIDLSQSPSAAGLLAFTPDEVGTVAVVWEITVQTGVYIGNDKALRLDWGVRLVDLERKTVVAEGYFRGDAPPHTKYGPGDATGDPPTDDLAIALKARVFAAPFEETRAQYLDPSWMSQTPEIDYELAQRLGAIDSVNGKLIVVSADTGQLLRPAFATSDSEPGPPDWGLSWAATPDEVGTVVIVWTFARPLNNFVDGTGYRQDYKVRVIDWTTKAVISDAYYYGETPATAKSCSGDTYSPPPWPDLMESLRAAPHS